MCLLKNNEREKEGREGGRKDEKGEGRREEGRKEGRKKKYSPCFEVESVGRLG